MESREMYDTIGKNYNSTRHADPFIRDRLYEHLQPGKKKTYIDIGCGTGNYTIALAQKGIRITGIDPSILMLTEARKRAPELNWLQGTSENIPVGDDLYDGVVATLTIHHWPDIARSFAEISRVLKPDSRIVLFTSTELQMKGYWLNHYFPEIISTSGSKMPSPESIEAIARHFDFNLVSQEKYFVKADLKDLFLYSGKFKPERYFDENILKGISSFWIFGHDAERENGLKQLRYDIDHGNFEEVKNKYENDNGDYLFMTFKRPAEPA